MYTYSKSSKEKLDTCHPELQRLFNEVLKTYDHTITCGHRNKEDQNAAFANGTSQLKWPNGNHNKTPSIAVDVAPFPVDYSNKLKVLARFYHFAGYVLATAERLGIPIRWGGDWDSDKIFTDQNFDDLPHFEYSGK